MRTFEITDEEEEKFKKWRDEIHKTDPDTTAIGGGFEFCFTPTGLGPIIVVKHISGKEIELAGSDNW